MPRKTNDKNQMLSEKRQVIQFGGGGGAGFVQRGEGGAAKTNWNRGNSIQT